jgi:hypothetical protein
MFQDITINEEKEKKDFTIKDFLNFVKSFTIIDFSIGLVYEECDNLLDKANLLVFTDSDEYFSIIKNRICKMLPPEIIEKTTFTKSKDSSDGAKYINLGSICFKANTNFSV